MLAPHQINLHENKNRSKRTIVRQLSSRFFLIRADDEILACRLHDFSSYYLKLVGD